MAFAQNSQTASMFTCCRECKRKYAPECNTVMFCTKYCPWSKVVRVNTHTADVIVTCANVYANRRNVVFIHNCCKQRPGSCCCCAGRGTDCVNQCRSVAKEIVYFLFWEQQTANCCAADTAVSHSALEIQISRKTGLHA